MCGADDGYLYDPASESGSPPRVRSRPSVDFLQVFVGGITSACAEQTGCPALPGVQRGDHLRVCGADPVPLHESGDGPGSPPRVRSRLAVALSEHEHDGITSACAEQTHRDRPVKPLDADHLRVCGADVLHCRRTRVAPGSPPRVRSRLVGNLSLRLHKRITSACAEQTHGAGKPAGRGWDHLRVCGADMPGLDKDGNLTGSPPRVRSRLAGVRFRTTHVGITSACAEQTYPS